MQFKIKQNTSLSKHFHHILKTLINQIEDNKWSVCIKDSINVPILIRSSFSQLFVFF